MRILYLSPWPPLPEDGGNSGMRHLAMNLLRYLAPRHHLDVVGFYRREEERSSGWGALEHELPLRVLATLPERSGLGLNWSRAGLFIRFLPASLARWESPQAAAYLGYLDLSIYDAVLLDTLYMAPYRRIFYGKPTVLLAPDALAKRYFAAARRGIGVGYRVRRLVEALLHLRLEATWYPQFDAVVFLSEADRSSVQRISPRSRTHAIQLPVDRAIFEAGARNRVRDTATRVVCWVSLFEPSFARDVAEFIEEAWPRIRAARPDAELIVWGQAPVPKVLGAVARHPSVTHIGFVSDWIETLSSMDILVCPIRSGTGIITKAVNALALGVPTVLSREVGASLGVTPGRDAEVCRTPEDYVSSCTRLLSNRFERERIAAAGREHALAAFGQEGPGRRLERVLEESVAARRSGLQR
jgi:glycosyltransferase involved in cell wall biosynthesis